MITNFKIFENNKINGQFWKIKNDEFIEVKLYKIGLDFITLDRFAEVFRTAYYENKYYFIGKYLSDRYTYDARQNEIFYRKKYFKYLGEPQIDENDIKDYEMKRNTIKYNL